MTAAEIMPEPLTPEKFLPFGDVLETQGEPTMVIDGGRGERFHDVCRLSFGRDSGIVGSSLP